MSAPAVAPAAPDLQTSIATAVAAIERAGRCLNPMLTEQTPHPAAHDALNALVVARLALEELLLC